MLQIVKAFLVKNHKRLDLYHMKTVRMKVSLGVFADFEVSMTPLNNEQTKVLASFGSVPHNKSRLMPQSRQSHTKTQTGNTPHTSNKLCKLLLGNLLRSGNEPRKKFQVLLKSYINQLEITPRTYQTHTEIKRKSSPNDVQPVGYSRPVSCQSVVRAACNSIETFVAIHLNIIVKFKPAAELMKKRLRNNTLGCGITHQAWE